MLDQPISKDWIFYLWIVSIIAIIPGTLSSELNGGGLASFLIGVVIQYLFFLVLPASTRKVIRKK